MYEDIEEHIKTAMMGAPNVTKDKDPQELTRGSTTHWVLSKYVGVISPPQTRNARIVPVKQPPTASGLMGVRTGLRTQ